MKKTYIKPSVEVMSFDAEDILKTSGYDVNAVSIIENDVEFSVKDGKVQVVGAATEQ